MQLLVPLLFYSLFLAYICNLSAFLYPSVKVVRPIGIRSNRKSLLTLTQSKSTDAFDTSSAIVADFGRAFRAPRESEILQYSGTVAMLATALLYSSTMSNLVHSYHWKFLTAALIGTSYILYSNNLGTEIILVLLVI